MAKREDADQRKGRLLFTDFEISGLGRPPGASITETETPAVLAKSLPSLKDVISTLDFSFEADEGDEEKAPAPFAAASDSFGPASDDDEDMPEDRQPRPPGRPTAIIPREDAGKTAVMDVDLDSLFGAAPDRSDQSDQPDRVDREVDSLFAHETGEDGIDDDWLAALDSLLDDFDSEGDLLAAMNTERHPAPAAGRSHPVPPPRPAPYGDIERVEDWFSPPEATDDEDRALAVERIEDWFEPPEDTGGNDLGATSVIHEDELAGLFDEPADAPAETYPEPKVSDSGRFETGEDIFADVDIEQEWSRRQAARVNSAGKDETADFLFDDLASLLDDFERRQDDRIDPEAYNPEDGDEDIMSSVSVEEALDSRPAYTEHEAADTMLLSTDALPADTMMMKAFLPPSEDRAAEPVAAPPKKEPEAGQPDEHRPEPAAPPAKPLYIDEPADEEGELSFAEDDDEEAESEPVDPSGPPALEDSPDSVLRLVGKPQPAEPGQPVESAVRESAVGPAEAEAATVEDDSAEAVAASPSPVAGGNDDYGLGDLAALADAAADQAKKEIAAPKVSDDDLNTDTNNMFSSGDMGEEFLPGAGDPLADPEPAAYGGSAGGIIRANSDGDDDLADLDRLADDEDGGSGAAGRLGGADDDGEAGFAEASDESGEPEGEPEAAVNPQDVFANMDAFDDFDDGLDDEMRAMLAEDDADDMANGGEGAEAASGNAGAFGPQKSEPKGFIGKLTGKIVDRLPLAKARQFHQMLSWRQNWWFYCDLVAAIIATASLAVIVSYFLWYWN